VKQYTTPHHPGFKCDGIAWVFASWYVTEQQKKGKNVISSCSTLTSSFCRQICTMINSPRVRFSHRACLINCMNCYLYNFVERERDCLEKRQFNGKTNSPGFNSIRTFLVVLPQVIAAVTIVGLLFQRTIT
jgi:hypothetical protein